jgi:hypothetical protein
MLGQHPQCYGLPELFLFFADDLGGVMRRTFVLRFIRDGLLRTLAQLHEDEQTDDSIARAWQWVSARSDWPVRRVFDHIQELVGPRVLVEKSPGITAGREFLERLLRNYPKAKLLHLVRHPRSTAESLINFREQFDWQAAAGRAAPDPERVWRISHELVVTVMHDLPAGQYMCIKGEALLSDLGLYLPQICEWLGVRSDSEAIDAMMHPENSPYAKLGPPSAPYGNDPNFLSNPTIDRERLAKIKEPRLDGDLSWRPGEAFAPATRRLAKQFGYH